MSRAISEIGIFEKTKIPRPIVTCLTDNQTNVEYRQIPLSKEPLLTPLVDRLSSKFSNGGDFDVLRASKIWMIIAWSHPELTCEALYVFAKKLKLPTSVLFQSSASIGCERFFDYLMVKFTEDRLTYLRDDGYKVIICAIENNQKSILKCCLDLLTSELETILVIKESVVLNTAINHLCEEIITYLLELAPVSLLPSMIRAKNYYAFHSALQSGNLDLIKRIRDAIPEQELHLVFTVANFRKLTSVLYTPNREQVEIFFLKQMTADARSKAITSGNFDIFDTLRRIGKRPSDEELTHCTGFHTAVHNGRCDVVYYMLDEALEELQKIFKFNGYAIFLQGGVYRVNLDMGIHLLQSALPEDVQPMITSHGYAPFLKLLKLAQNKKDQTKIDRLVGFMTQETRKVLMAEVSRCCHEEDYPSLFEPEKVAPEQKIATPSIVMHAEAVVPVSIHNHELEPILRPNNNYGFIAKCLFASIAIVGFILVLATAPSGPGAFIGATIAYSALGMFGLKCSRELDCTTETPSASL